MKTVLTNGLSPEKKEELRSIFKASGFLRERLVQLLEDKARSARKASESKEAYEVAHWPYLQADRNGYVRALEEIQSLLK